MYKVRRAIKTGNALDNIKALVLVEARSPQVCIQNCSWLQAPSPPSRHLPELVYRLRSFCVCGAILFERHLPVWRLGSASRDGAPEQQRSVLLPETLLRTGQENVLVFAKPLLLLYTAGGIITNSLVLKLRNGMSGLFEYSTHYGITFPLIRS